MVDLRAFLRKRQYWLTYKQAGSRLVHLAIQIGAHFDGSPYIPGDIGYPISEMLKNAFFHGNRYDFSKRILLKLEADAAGNIVKIHVFDEAVKKKLSKRFMEQSATPPELRMWEDEPITGAGEGIKQIERKGAIYKRENIRGFGTHALVKLSPSRFSSVKEPPPRAEVRKVGITKLPLFRGQPSFDNLQGRFTVFADLDDVANLTDKQLTEDYEKTALRHKNVSFVFYNDQKAIPKEMRDRVERLQEQLGSHRIQITVEEARSVFSRQWAGELIHVSKRPGITADLLTSIPRKKGLHRFRYLGDETGVVPVALLYVNQGSKGFENKVIDLSMVDERLIAQVLAYQAGLVFARSA